MAPWRSEARLRDEVERRHYKRTHTIILKMFDSVADWTIGSEAGESIRGSALKEKKEINPYNKHNKLEDIVIHDGV